MKKMIILLCILASGLLPAIVQDTPRVEVFGGYSRIIGEQQGVNVSVAGNVNRWFGVVADFGRVTSKLTEADVVERITGKTYLFGPQFSVRKNKRVTVFVRGLFGASNIKAKFTNLNQNAEFSQTNFSYGVGGGLDIRVSKVIAIRAIQADYIHTKFFGEGQNNGRLSFGVVFRLGGK